MNDQSMLLTLTMIILSDIHCKMKESYSEIEIEGGGTQEREIIEN